MNKVRNIKVDTYTFNELRPENEKKNFFLTEDDSEKDGSEVQPFKLSSLKEAASFQSGITEDTVRVEREFELEKSFAIDPAVREHRGLKDQEAKDFEIRVENEVRKRVDALRASAYQEGYGQGLEKGHTQAYQETMKKGEEKIESLSEILSSLREETHKILQTNKDDTIHMVKNLTKWITLQEIREKDYLSRLLEKLIFEINHKTNLLVHVNKNSFKYMPEVLEKVKQSVGELPNIRVEIDIDQSHAGIVLESENGIIDGSFEAQMTALDRIFEDVLRGGDSEN